MFNRNKIIGCTFALTTIFSSSSVFAKEGERHITLVEDVASADLIKLNVPAGQVIVTGTTGNSVTIDMTATCEEQKDKKSCAQLLKELAWVKKNDGTAELGLAPSEITHYDNVKIMVKFGVPKNKKLEVNLSAGELRIDGTSACLTAEVNAGDLGITLKEDQVASAQLYAKVGDVTLTTPKGGKISGERSLLVGAKLEWNKGTGSCNTKASVLAGEARLVLN